MIIYVKNIMNTFSEEIKSTSNTLAEYQLFKIRVESKAKLLLEGKSISFQHIMNQLLFMATRVSRDSQLYMVFLTTYMKNHSKYNWGKLKRVLKYLKEEKHIKLAFKVDFVSMFIWWVDVYYNTRED